jgi:hypothetical protein
MMGLHTVEKGICFLLPQTVEGLLELVEHGKGLTVCHRQLTLEEFKGLINLRQKREHILWVKMCNLCSAKNWYISRAHCHERLGPSHE